jgi:hypothetical protein
VRWGLLALAACGRIGFGETAPGDADAALLTYRDAVLADLPVGYWRLDDLDTTARDELGQTNGTYQGTCTHGVAGALANDPSVAVDFDGASCYVALADKFNFAGTAPFSVEAWVSTTKTTTEHFFTRQNRNGLAPLDGYALLLGPQNSAYLERTVGGVDHASSKSPIAHGPFVHVVGVYSGSAQLLYVDGALVGAASADPASLNSISFVALLGVSDPAQNYGFFQGVLDEVAVYDHVLDPARIQLHHDIAVNGPR